MLEIFLGNYYASSAAIWAHAALFLNSNFVTALVGSGFGAYAGAYTVQLLAERASIVKDLTLELRNTNAALTLAVMCANSAMSLRSQFSKELLDEYLLVKEDIKQLRNFKLIDPDTLYFSMNLGRFPKITFPIERLQEVIQSRLSAAGKELSLVGEAETVIAALQNAMDERDKFCEVFSKSDYSEEMKIAIYLGNPTGNGQTDTTYGDLVKSIDQYAADLAYFSAALCDELMVRGQAALRELIKIRRKNIHKHQLISVDFSDARKAGLLPSDEEYPHWLERFEKEKPTRYLKIRVSALGVCNGCDEAGPYVH